MGGPQNKSSYMGEQCKEIMAIAVIYYFTNQILK
jgi:hypothetical protein